MYREKNKATCRQFIQQIFNEGDLLSIRDFVSPDSLHHELDDVSVPAGHSSEWLADMIHLYRLAFPDLQVEIQDQIAESDRVVTCLRMQGTQTGPLLGIGVSGKTVDVTGIRIDRLAESKITESWFHWDGLGMLQQIGALPGLARNPQAAPWANETTPLPPLTPFPVLPMRTEMQRPSAAQLRPAA
jgi:predicted ester cyclase